jgi:hypothetical protein
MVCPSRVCKVKLGALNPWRGADISPPVVLPGGVLLNHIHPAPTSSMNMEKTFQSNRKDLSLSISDISVRVKSEHVKKFKLHFISHFNFLRLDKPDFFVMMFEVSRYMYRRNEWC